jgi:hypothetical protein
MWSREKCVHVSKIGIGLFFDESQPLPTSTSDNTAYEAGEEGESDEDGDQGNCEGGRLICVMVVEVVEVAKLVEMESWHSERNKVGSNYTLS